MTREFDQAKHFFNHGENIRGLRQLAVAFLSIPYSWVSLPFSLVEDLAEMGILTKTLDRLLNTFGQRQRSITLTGYKISAFANMIFMAPLYILSLPWKIIEDICDMAQTLTNERIMKNTLDNIREIARLDPIKLYDELHKSIIWGFPVFLDSMVFEILKLPFSICLDIPSLIYEVVSLPWTIAAGIKSVWDTVVGSNQEVIREPSSIDYGLAEEDLAIIIEGHRPNPAPGANFIPTLVFRNTSATPGGEAPEEALTTSRAGRSSPVTPTHLV